MSPQTIESRLESLEQRVTILEQLPARIDGLTLQIVQLREQMHAAISASETSLKASFEASLQSEIHGASEALREDIRAGDEETRRVLRNEFQGGFKQLRGEIHKLRADVMAQARTLYEDMKATLALIKEALPPTS